MASGEDLRDRDLVVLLVAVARAMIAEDKFPCSERARRLARLSERLAVCAASPLPAKAGNAAASGEPDNVARR